MDYFDANLLCSALCKKEFNSFLNENRYEHLFWLNCISTRLSPITPPLPIYATHSHLHHTQRQRPIYVKWITFNRLINEPIAGLKRNINSFVSRMNVCNTVKRGNISLLNICDIDWVCIKRLGNLWLKFSAIAHLLQHNCHTHKKLFHNSHRGDEEFFNQKFTHEKNMA